MKSFFKLLTYCNDAKYYAYCDQDDVWLPNKIKLAVEQLDKMNNDIPTLYASNFDYYDSNMNFLEHSHFNKKKPWFGNALVECVSPGMTMCINNKTRLEIINNIPSKCMFHDWWTYMVSSGLGEVYYDNTVTVKYRRHDKNVTSECMNFFQLQIWRIKTFILGKHFEDVKEQMRIYKQLYYNKLNEDNKNLLDIFTDKNSVKNFLKKIFYSKKYRYKTSDNFLIRLMILIGKL